MRELILCASADMFLNSTAQAWVSSYGDSKSQIMIKQNNEILFPV